MVSQGQAFQCMGQFSAVSFEHFRPGPQLYYLACVYMRVCVCYVVCMCVCCVHACEFSDLVHQHLCPLIMTVMICQQITYAPKKPFSSQLQLLVSVAATTPHPRFPTRPPCKRQSLPWSISLYIPSHVFHGCSLFLALSVSLLRYTASFGLGLL